MDSFSRLTKFVFEKEFFFLIVFKQTEKTERSRHENSIYLSMVFVQKILRL